jgi:flagellar motor switch/type III secretory pathway protein FliN
MSTRELCEPVVQLGTSRRQRLQQALQQAIDEWRQQWSGSTHGAFEVDVAEALCRRPAVSGGRALAFAASAGADRLLAMTVPVETQHELVGVPSPRTAVDGAGETASAVLEEALRALCLRLTHAKAAERVNVATLPAEKLPQTWGQYGLTITVKAAGGRALMRARLFPELLMAMLPSQIVKPTEPLSSRRSAIGIEPVAVQAWLGEAEVSLDELAKLQIGDVIVLEATVSSAGHLALPDGRELAQIRLGSTAGKRAVSVVGKSAGQPSRSV